MTTQNLKLFFLLVLVFSASLRAQKATNYIIDIEFFPKDSQMWGYKVSNDAFVRGSAIVTLSEPIKEATTFYLHGEFKIDSIYSGNHKIEFQTEKIFYKNSYSLVALKTQIKSSRIVNQEIEISYSGFINPSRSRSLSDYMKIDKKEGVYLRGYGYSLWFPVFLNTGSDTYATNFEKVSVTTPKKMKTIVNGKRLGETIEREQRKTLWSPGKIDISNIQCTARNYDKEEKNNITVYHIGDKEQADKIIDFTNELKAVFFSSLKKTHHTKELYIIEMPEYGNISSDNVIGISKDIYQNFENDLYSKLTIAHELVHPFVVIPVSKENKFSALISEGFPSFFHLYGLAKMTTQKTFDIKSYMRRVESRYIQNKKTGTDRRGNTLPKEKPILEISFDEIGVYKDRFILSDRAILFLYKLWELMDDKKYDDFLSSLFKKQEIDYATFENLVTRFLPNYQKELHLWLKTNDYPERIRLRKD